MLPLWSWRKRWAGLGALLVWKVNIWKSTVRLSFVCLWLYIFCSYRVCVGIYKMRHWEKHLPIFHPVSWFSMSVCSGLYTARAVFCIVYITSRIPVFIQASVQYTETRFVGYRSFQINAKLPAFYFVNTRYGSYFPNELVLPGVCSFSILSN